MTPEVKKPVITLTDLEGFMTDHGLTVLNIHERFEMNTVVVFVSENDQELFVTALQELRGRTPLGIRVEIEHQGGPYR